MNRREFVKQTALGAVVAGFPAVIPSSARGAAGKTAPNDKINVGCIGTGPQGRGVMWNFLAQNDARVTAVCDVKDDQLKIARDTVNGHYKNSDCATYRDFKEVLARKDIDVVLIATPDHWHVPIAVAAAEAGKDMYVEKPMGLTVAEDKILREAIKKHKRVFQFGTQQRSGENFWRACELVRNGYIGELKHVNVWSPASHPGGATDPLPVPPGIDYDRWLGPAPYTPYTKNKCSDSNKTWWFNYDYALGFIAGWGVHPLDIALWGSDAFMAGPLEAEGRAVIPTIGACNTAIAWWVNFKCSDGVTADFFGTPNGYSVISKMNNLASFEKKYRTVLTHGTAFEG
ncbi:MAG: Gfo/Idh/MocA family oxidoreductase, partial [Verrucomicrobia bacterium]|nr:Gfo/Idh/MocA family oxidoreductase [Verrucomicrobiota bacterium]